MNDGTFQKMGKSSARMFGPPCILVCGYGVDEQEKILALFKSCDLSQHPVVFAAEHDQDKILKELVVQQTSAAVGIAIRS